MVVLTLPACATSDSPAVSDAVYEATATVLQAPGEPVMLCVGIVLTSLPPQCGDVPITNWDWDEVDDEETQAGTTWGDWHVTGSFDGETFTLVQSPEPPRRATDDGEDPITTPCAQPLGGWTPPQPLAATEEAMHEAIAYARAHPDFAGVWLDHLTPPEGTNDPLQTILNVAFTGDISAREAELQEIWGGALCVVEHEHTMAMLESIQEELFEVVKREFGLITISVGASDVRNRVELEVVHADDTVQAWLDDRYGTGVVRLATALVRVN